MTDMIYTYNVIMEYFFSVVILRIKYTFVDCTVTS